MAYQPTGIPMHACWMVWERTLRADILAPIQRPLLEQGLVEQAKAAHLNLGQVDILDRSTLKILDVIFRLETEGLEAGACDRVSRIDSDVLMLAGLELSHRFHRRRGASSFFLVNRFSWNKACSTLSLTA
jgi:hypothetical protein